MVRERETEDGEFSVTCLCIYVYCQYVLLFFRGNVQSYNKLPSFEIFISYSGL